MSICYIEFLPPTLPFPVPGLGALARGALFSVPMRAMGENTREFRRREAWFASLRERFLSIARRRVPEDTAEDLVQEALRIIHEKAGFDPGADSVDGDPPLAWCFQVLRNVIGNHYQKERTRSRPEDEAKRTEAASPLTLPTPLEALESREVDELLAGAIGEVEREGGPCGGYLRRLAAGVEPAALADQDGVAPAILYRRLYRCRKKLRTILHRKGVLT